MEAVNSSLRSFINMIKKAVLEEEREVKGFGIKERSGRMVYGRMIHGMIINPIMFQVVNRNSLCQDLYDCLIEEFGDQLQPGHAHSSSGVYKYYMLLGNIWIFFPEDYIDSRWAYNQIKKDREKAEQEKGPRL